MAIRKIRYNVTSLGVTPASHQWGGVQNEDNATEVIYFLDAEYLRELGNIENLRFRIDFNSASAGYEPSENLEMKDYAVSRSIPKRITQYGGQVLCTLVISEIVPDRLPEVSTEVLQIPSVIFFTSSDRKDKRIIENLSAYEEYVIRLMTEVSESAEEAIRQVEIVNEKIENGDFNGKDYILTNADKIEIAQMIKNETLVDVSEVGQ